VRVTAVLGLPVGAGRMRKSAAGCNNKSPCQQQPTPNSQRLPQIRRHKDISFRRRQRRRHSQ
jgi:hypothetical protein